MQGVVQSCFDGMGQSASQEECFGLMFDAAKSMGFSALAYDYTPVPRSDTGELIAPRFLRSFGAPDGFDHCWVTQDFYAVDMIWQTCVDTTSPFIWSSDGQCCDRNVKVLDLSADEMGRPVFDYLSEWGLRIGATVPLHLPDGGLGTLTAIGRDADAGFVDDVMQNLGSLALLAHRMQDQVAASFDASLRACRHFQLSPRELECLQLAAEGYTTKQVADKICRSLATAALHLNNAIRKLGARNRTHAIARAAHFGLLDKIH
jgi:LuxR family transcriptional regulator, quorum-sensing system regulator SdiA